MEEGITPVGLSAKNKPKCVQFFTLLGIKMYGMDFQKKFIDGNVDWNDPQVMAVLNQFKYYIDMGIFGPDAISFSYDNVMADFEQGKVAVLFELSYQFAKIQAMHNSGDFKCVNVFSFKNKPEYRNLWFTDYFEGLCIGAKPGTKEYEAAEKLFSFMLSQETFNQYAETMGGGAYPIEVEFDQNSVGNIMRDFMEEYKSCSDITTILTAYCNDPVIADLTASELQTLFVGRSTDDVAKTLNSEYQKAFQK
jgi:ABC-type glycerol-3-phosphate transport system substrate-binding protein